MERKALGAILIHVTPNLWTRKKWDAEAEALLEA